MLNIAVFAEWKRLSADEPILKRSLIMASLMITVFNSVCLSCLKTKSFLKHFEFHVVWQEKPNTKDLNDLNGNVCH